MRGFDSIYVHDHAHIFIYKILLNMFLNHLIFNKKKLFELDVYYRYSQHNNVNFRNYQHVLFELMKGKALRKHSLHEKTAASVFHTIPDRVLNV